MKGQSNTAETASSIIYQDSTVADKLDSLSTAVADTVSKANGGTFNGDVSFDDADGTTTTEGNTLVEIGNSKGVGVDGNSTGRLRIYSKTGHYINLYASPTASVNRNIYFPDNGGILALTSDSETSYTKLGSVEKASALNTAVSLSLSDSIDNYKYLWLCVSYYDSGVASYGGTMVQTKLAKLIYGQDAGIRVVCLSGTTYGDVAFKIASTTSIQCVAETNIIGRYYVVYGLN